MAPGCRYVVYMGRGSVLSGCGKCTPPSFHVSPFLYFTVKTHAVYEHGEIHRALENFRNISDRYNLHSDFKMETYLPVLTRTDTDENCNLLRFV